MHTRLGGMNNVTATLDPGRTSPAVSCCEQSSRGLKGQTRSSRHRVESSLVLQCQSRFALLDLCVSCRLLQICSLYAAVVKDARRSSREQLYYLHYCTLET
mmetsp:Transcript_55164/g.131459  ORF Transcript_55164/g.131459 Transcript_55164/m.131459 type:complete len:101 (+) Transcript_55164:84-386(+)